jgi:hypothetical protein
MSGRPRPYPLAAGLFVVGALLLASPWLLGTVTIPWDAKAEAWPNFAFLARSFAEGDSPFWTPNVFAGHPQVADPQSLIFAPQFLLMAWLDNRPSFIAEDAAVFAMLIAGGLALMAFFRDRGWRAEGALVCAFAFSFGCSNAWRLQHVGQVSSLCWFAIALLCLSRGLDRASAPWGLLAGVTAGFMALGRDQVGLLCAYALVVFTAWRVFDGAGVWTRLRGAIPPLLAGAVGGVATTLVPFALTLAFAGDSNRPTIDFDGAGRGSLPPLALLTAVVANLFGVDGPNDKFWGPPVSLTWGPADLALARNMAEVYFGALPLAALACVGVARGALRERAALVFTTLAALMGLFALGRFTPFFAIAYHLPGVDFYRRPADATFPMGAALAIAAGYCVHRAFAEERRLPQAGVLGVVGLFGVCVFIAADRERFQQATPALLTGGLFLGCALAALAILPRLAKRRPAAALAALAVLMTLDLAVDNRPNESTALPPRTYEALAFDSRDETVALIKAKLAEYAAPDRRDRVELAGIGYDWPNVGLAQGFDHDLGFNPLRTKLFADVTRVADQVAEPSQREFSPLFPSYRSPMADLLGLRLIATGAPPQSIDKSLKPGDLEFVARTGDAFVWENPRALPRVLLATRAWTADFDKLIAEGGMPDIDYRANVLLRKEEAPGAPDIAAFAAGPGGHGTARVLSYRNTDVLIEADAPEGGWLELNDVWHPWWRCEVDGAAVPILRANVMFRAVKLAPGRHVVRFTFHPFAGLWRDWFGG